MPDITPTITSAELRRKWKQFDYRVALDPGSTTGCAIRDMVLDQLECRTLDFWAAAALPDEFDPEFTIVFIEDPRLNPFAYDRHEGEGGIAARSKIQRNVGMNQADAKRLAEAFEAAGFRVEMVQPTGKKWDRDRCRMLTGYDGSPNNAHVRDAIRLLYEEGAL